MTKPGPVDRGIARTLEFVISHRRVVFYVLLAVSLLLTAGAARLHVENNFRAFVGDDNEALATSDWLGERQGQGLESVVLIYRPADHDALSAVSVLQYVELVSRAARLPHVRSVSSWLDIQKLLETGRRGPDGRSERLAAPFLFGVDVLTLEGAQVLRADALATPAVAGRYVGRDGASALVVVGVDLGEGHASRRERVEALLTAVGGLQDDLARVAPGDTLSLSGVTLFDHASYLILREDLRLIFPLAVLMVAGILYAIYRSVAFVALFMLLTLLPVLATAGLAGWFEAEFSNLSVAGLLLVGTLAVADVMHLSNSYFLLVGQGMGKEESLRYAFRHNLFAVTATTSTTIMGEAVLFFTSPRPVQLMGIVVITGSAIALFIALTMLPHALAIVRPPGSDALRWLSDGMARLAAFAHRRATPVIMVLGGLVVVCAAALPLARIDDSLEGWFGESTAYHRDLALLEQQYMGTNTIVLALEVRPEDQLAARNYPEQAEATTLYARLNEDLRKVGGSGEWLSVVEMAKARRALLDSGAPTGYRLVDGARVDGLKPFSADALSRAGLLTRYDPGRTDYSIWYFHSHSNSSFELIDTSRRLHDAMVARADGRDVRSGGVGVALAQVSVTNLRQVLYGSVAVFALIVASMFVVFRSFWLGAVSIVPNLAPVAFAFGLWAWWAGGINMAAVTVLGVAFGIVVDDTIHVLTKYRENMEAGLGSEAAFTESIRECGVGILATTMVLAGGFALLGASNFLLTAQRSQLTALTITSALLFDLMLLPALLALVRRGPSFRQVPAERHAPPA